MWIRTLFDSLKPGASRPPARPARAGASRRRPAPCRLSVETLDDRIVPASLSVGDVTIIEGDAGTRYAAVRVSLDAPSNSTVTVNYGTANGTAVAGSDYDAISGKLTFAPGETSKTILVPVRGDQLVESNENFSVNLSGARHAKIADRQGVVTIVDDEPRISIGTVIQYEGNSGTTPFVFTVTLPAAYEVTVTVNYATADGTATAGHDYLATSGTLVFAPGETTKTITVEVVGDFMIDEYESFYVNLSGASSHGLVDVQGTGFIVDDEIPPPGPPGCDQTDPNYPNC